jgi:hypothetical protein
MAPLGIVRKISSDQKNDTDVDQPRATSLLQAAEDRSELILKQPQAEMGRRKMKTPSFTTPFSEGTKYVG